MPGIDSVGIDSDGILRGYQVYGNEVDLAEFPTCPFVPPRYPN